MTRDGVPALVSKHRYVVMLRPASAVIRSSGRPSFIVAVYNPTKSPGELRVAGISARQTDAKNQTVNVHVYTYEELIGEVQRKQRWATFAAALGGVGNVAQIGTMPTRPHLQRCAKTLKLGGPTCSPAKLDEFGEDEEPPTTDAEGLRRFLESEVLPWFDSRRVELANRPLIREQAFGEALDPDKLERLSRYEVHLDRKLERMLAMLLRLKELRQRTVSG